MEDKKCPKCGSTDIVNGEITGSFGPNFVPDTETGPVKKVHS